MTGPRHRSVRRSRRRPRPGRLDRAAGVGRCLFDALLESRVAPAVADLTGGVLTYTAADGEANRLTVEVANISGTNYVRLRDDGSGIAIQTTGTGLIADSTAQVRAASGDVTQLVIALGDGDDQATLKLGAGLPAAISLDGGTATTADKLTVVGPGGGDAIDLAPRRNADGIKVVRLADASTTLMFGGVEDLTVDVSQPGADSVTIDRYVSTADRPLAISVVGDGAGDDTLALHSDGEMPQVTQLGQGSVRIDEAPGGKEVLLGRSDNVAIDQPRATVEVIDPNAPGGPLSFGPESFNTFLLDTGATGILAASEATNELVNAGYQTYSIPYDEGGVSGSTPMDVSLPYRVDFAGDSGVRQTLNNFQMLSSLDLSFSFFGPWGIVGMPAMVNRVTTVDMSGWLNPQDVTDLAIHTDFSQDPPADTGHMYHVPLSLVDFPASGQRPGGPVPTFAPLPFLDVKARDDGHEFSGRFLLDTGAQLSIISTKTALALGLDKNHDGSLEDEAVDHTEISGIGGTTTIPILPFDRLAVPTAEGPDLVWTDLLVGVTDINTDGGPPIDGVLGMDYLTSGWASKILPLLTGDPGSDQNGYFSHVYFDFRDAANHDGTLIFDVVPSHDVVSTPDPNTLTLTHSQIGALSVATGAGDDTFRVAPSTTTTYTINGGPQVNGDELALTSGGSTATDDGSTINVPGSRPIHYSDIERVDLGGPDTTGPSVNKFSLATDTGIDPHDELTDDTTPVLTFEFSEPTSWTDAGISVKGPDGATVAPAGVSGSGTRTLTVTLPTLTRDGTYTVTLDSNVFRDASGNRLGDGTDYKATFRLDATPPSAKIDAVTPSPRPDAVAAIAIHFSEPVFGFDLADLSLTLNGGPNLLGGSQALTTADNITYTLKNLASLTAGAGAYTLKLNAAVSGITDAAGNAPAGDSKMAWQVETASASFVDSDPTTQGNWQGVYGADGFNVIADAVSYPAYAQVAASGQKTYAWASSTADVRALQRGGPGETGRIAATWYGGQFTIDLNLTDGQSHRVGLYALDWDSTSRQERIDVLGAASGAVLDSRTIASFHGGEYLSWKLSGHVQIRVTRLAGSNAVISGLFFGDAPPPTSGTAAFVGSDATTEGNWQGVYGADGFTITADAASYPSYATVSASGQKTYTWASSTADARALQRGGPGETGRIAATWYGGQFTIDLNLTDGKAHTLSLYALDWDSTSRQERIDVVDPSSGKVLDSRTIASFHGGEYLTWTLSGHVQIRVTRLAGANAAVSGLFFGEPSLPSHNTAKFVGTDTTTAGNWKGSYGADGFNIVADAASYPSYAAVSASGQKTYTWASSTTDVRALQRGGPGETGRIAATWYGGQFTIDLNLTDGKAHKLSLYALDWDTSSRQEQIDVIDAATGAVLDSRTIASFHGGEYLSWMLSGHVQIRITRLAGANAVVSGLFFDPNP